MIQEQYVSFEVARLLKEKGFNIPTSHVYSDKHDLLRLTDYAVKDLTNEDCDGYSNWHFPIKGVKSIISAPTTQMVIDWLIETCKLYCDVGYDTEGWYIQIVCLDQQVEGVDGLMKIYHPTNTYGYCSYHSAREADIKYCLENLI